MRKTRFGRMILLLFGIEPAIVNAQTILDGAGLSVRGGPYQQTGINILDFVRSTTAKRQLG